MLSDQQIGRAAFDLWRAEIGTDNQLDTDRLKRMLPVVMKECCTEKQQIYITHYFAYRMTTTEIAALYGINKSTVSRTIHAGLHNLHAHIKFCSPELCQHQQKNIRLRQKKTSRKNGELVN